MSVPHSASLDGSRATTPSSKPLSGGSGTGKLHIRPSSPARYLASPATISRSTNILMPTTMSRTSEVSTPSSKAKPRPSWAPHDPRLKLNTVVTEVDYSNEDLVNVATKDGSCYQAKHVICTFSLGVLQHSIVGDAPVTFKPDFPRWKEQAILGFGTMTHPVLDLLH